MNEVLEYNVANVSGVAVVAIVVDDVSSSFSADNYLR